MNDFWVLIEDRMCYPRYYGRNEKGEITHCASVTYAYHFKSSDDAVASIPNDGISWKPMYVNWLKEK